jgi:1,4-dihydroxy-6-naphthoate synthase
MSAAADDRPLLRLGHSPDPDDAFMWWPLTADPLTGRTPMGTGRFRFEPVLRDIETLNRDALRGELEITAMSCAAYPAVRGLYVITACGASMGGGYGPKLVAGRPMTLGDLRRDDVVMAIPGRSTSAFTAASLLLGPGSFRHEERPFDRIIDDVASGRYAAGLVIHEGQLTYAERGLHLIEDLGAWWTRTRGLPLPLGMNTVRRDMDDLHGRGAMRDIVTILSRSVRFALDHREEALTYALRFGRKVARQTADRFVDMYVNHWTLDFGDRGREAVRQFLAEASEAGLAADAGSIDFVAETAAR